jgi:3-hydroxyacyl-CoA dehydrogenase
MGSNTEDKTRTRTIERVAIIGAGVMGHGIAQVFAQHGCTVKLHDRNSQSAWLGIICEGV